MPEARTGDEEDLDLDSIERELRGRQEDLRSRMAEFTKPPERGSGVQFGKRIGDGTNEAISRLTEVGVVDTLAATEARIARALEKIEEGSYGRCDNCGAEIPAGRLRAAPESAECVNCARDSRRRPTR